MDAARAMYGANGDDSALYAQMGIPPELWEGMREAAVVEIWPENMPAVGVFTALATQWRIGMNGPTGLDYAVLPATLKFAGVKKSQRAAVFEQVRIMEAAALAALASKKG